MSLDYPYYEELCRRKHRAAWCWLVGDRLYYLGLLPAVMAIAVVPIVLVAGLLGYGWSHLITTIVVFVAGVAVFVVGAWLKGRAYTLAEREGILAADVYRRQGPNVP